MLSKLDHLVSRFLVDMETKVVQACPSKSLQDVICPYYFKPDIDKLLRNAHSALRKLLPVNDCEDWEVIKVARRYYNYWKPKKTKVVILAESHAFTTKVSITIDSFIQRYLTDGT